MLPSVRCPECSSQCLTLAERSRREQILLLLTGRQHYECGGCGKAFDARDRRAAMRRRASLFLLSVALASASTLYYHAYMFQDFSRLVQREWQADVVSIRDDRRLATIETGTLRGEIRRLWADMKYQVGRLKDNLESTPANSSGSPGGS